MARNKMSWVQRQELHEILHWTNSPAESRSDFLVKKCVKHWLNGEDAHAELEKLGITGYLHGLYIHRAMTFIGNERARRRSRAAEILEARRTTKWPEFTSGNIGVTMDHLQHRDFGMANVSIYCLVEVWVEGDEAEAEKEYLINFSDYKTKEWLTKLLVWALTNQREVLIKAATAEEMASMTMFIPREKERA